MQHQEPLKQLFQQEFTKMVAVIGKLFGLAHIELAEDLVSETFLQASTTWAKKGVPENPAAWLYAVAKQKTLAHFRRSKIYTEKVMPQVSLQQEEAQEMEPDFSPKHIQDSQLQMIFAVCNPAIASEAQIGLALRILCGFGIDEIAAAFLSNKETINKRLFRAKEKLRSEQVKLEFPPASEISARLDNVLHVIYLLFSEGYYSKTQNEILRKDLCLEALRLGLFLTDEPTTNLPKTNALIALMCFHASRFAARTGADGALVLYEAQDPSLWDIDLIHQGRYFLAQSAEGHELSTYHLEAQIAYWHCQKEDTPQKWEAILRLYNELLFINYSPSVALNRTFALYKANGREETLVEAKKLKLEHSHFYFLLLAELHKDLDDTQAKQYLEKALALAQTEREKTQIRTQIAQLS